MTTQTLPPLTLDELGELRWLGREVVTHVGTGFLSGESEQGTIHDLMRVAESAVALASMDAEHNDAAPSAGGDGRWPIMLQGHHHEVLSREAAELERWLTSLMEDDEVDGSVVLRARNRVAECRTILARLDEVAEPYTWLKARS